ncbi:MAG: hypothetical protein LBH24_04480, partial [Clostridiales bacterium]|nr:hypothetical protein [Clostridiales bacterium]
NFFRINLGKRRNRTFRTLGAAFGRAAYLLSWAFKSWDIKMRERVDGAHTARDTAAPFGQRR